MRPHHAEAQELAAAVRRFARRRRRREGAGRYRGVVVSVDPLRVEVAALDDTLDEDEVTVWDSLAAHLERTEPLKVGDNVLLHELTDEDFAAVDVVRGDEDDEEDEA